MLVIAAPLTHADTDPAQYQVQGRELLSEGRYQEAAEAFRQAVLLSSQARRREAEPAAPETDAAANARLSRWHAQQAKGAMAKKAYLQALSHAERALELDPANRHAATLFTKARNAFEASKQRWARKIHFVAQAVEAERQRQDTRALILWKKARALDPDDPKIREAMKAVQARLNARRPVARRAVDFYPVAQQRPATSEYILSTGDVLEVFIWQQPDLSRNVIVRPDGRISYPLVGDVEAAGKSLTELDAMLTDRLKTYLRFPDVSLSIQRFGGTKTIVLGEVASPGVYVPAGEGRVLEVLAMAGGFTQDAVEHNVMLIRGGLTSPQVAKLDLSRALNRGALEENVLLQPDDILYVPKTSIASTLDFMERFYPTISETLVGQSIATNFGTDVRIQKSDRSRP
ncbi:MAG: polysaccharide biosynthesis/export family protein [Candidatus Omnitrophica bacterium]|nr:polysaccharide biosynthesis/export family protein [Candidatus Omnitrophota bacterium]